MAHGGSILYRSPLTCVILGARLTGESAEHRDDIAALAKGGRTNVAGFLLRLAARLPFLFVAGRWYGPEVLGRFAYAILIVELVAQLATLGLRRGLAAELARAVRPHAHVVADAMVVTTLIAGAGAALLIAVPQVMFPNSSINGLDRFLPLIVIAIALTEISLAALAYRYDIASTVRARSIVEPWTISIAACLFAWAAMIRDGLILSYVASMIAAMVAALWPLFRSYGIPRGWSPRLVEFWRMSSRNWPLAAADAIEWGSRRLDLAILGLFATPAIVGIYYIAQQVASLPQKLKTSFEPILGPVVTRNLAENNRTSIARQISQVGFWIISAQAGVGLALGIPGEAVMGLVGQDFVGGTGALIFLLAAEVVACSAVVSEAALIYMARLRNLAVSVLLLGVQAALTVGLIIAARHADWPPLYQAAMPALALMIALAFSSFIKTRLLAGLLGAPIRIWRPALIWSVAAASLLGYLATQLPEWLELSIGVPAILAAYAYVIWTRGFRTEDRELFRKSQRDADPIVPAPQ